MLFPELLPEEDGELLVSFSVPRGARSFVLTVTPRSPRRVLLVSLRGPGDVLLFDALADEPSGSLAAATTMTLEDELPLSVLYPNAPDAPFEPGTFRARLFLDDVATDADPATSVDVVLGRPVDEEAQRMLGIKVWLAAGASLTAADVATSSRLLQALGEVRTIFSDAGIAIGDIGVDDLGSSDEPLAVVDSPAAKAAIVAELAGTPGQGIHVVLVDRIESGAGGTVLGTTTSIPLPPPHAELARRGAVIIGLESLPNSAARVAELIAHEIGHALGLRHTTEAEGLRHDPLEDTADCPAALATFETPSGLLLLSAEDCEDLDGDNLLFYTPPRDSVPQRTLTEDQRFVLTRHPSVL